MRRLLIAGLIVSAQLACASAQTTTEPEALARALKFSDQVVRVIPKRLDGGPASEGFGIIIGEDGRKLYIATPRHVAFGEDRISSLSATPSVVFRSAPYSPVEAERLDVAGPLDDLAVVAVPAPRGLTPPQALMIATSDFQRGEWVWNIGIGGAWEAPDRAGGLGGLDAATNLIHVGALRTPLGASGGAGVTQNGVIGMVLQDGGDYSLLLPAERIVQLFTFWQLPANLLIPAPAPAPVARSVVETKGTAASFCDDLGAVLSLTGEDFVSIRKGLGSTVGWSTDALLSGFSVCNVKKTDDISYVCEENDVDDKKIAVAQVSELADKVSKCLGKSWSMTHYPAIDSIGFRNLGSADNVAVSFIQIPTSSDNLNYYTTSIQIYRHDPKKNAEAANITPPAQPEGFCDALKLIIKAGEAQFSELLGTRVGEGKEWRPKSTLRTWNRCRINSFNNSNTDDNTNKERRWFTCEVGPFGSKTAVEYMARRVAADLKDSCLPDTWSVSPRRSSGELRLKFESDDTGPTVELRTATNGDETWLLKLDVNGPQ